MAKAARLKRVDESDEEVESKPDNELDTSQFEDPEGAASDSDDSEEDEEAEAETVQKREREPKLMAVKDGHEGMEILRCAPPQAAPLSQTDMSQCCSPVELQAGRCALDCTGTCLV
jgi:hypothetical protein